MLNSLLDQSYSLLRTQANSGYFLDLFDKSDQFQVPVEAYRKCSHISSLTVLSEFSPHYPDTEAGPGVLEAALGFCSAERMGDNALLFKYLAKSVGMKHGVMPSFMAKIWPEVCSLPWLS